MATPTWTVGEVLAASDVNSWFVPIVRVKPTDEGPITTTTLQNDNDLILPLDIGATYALDGYLYATGNTIGSGDFKMGFTVPAAATYRFTTWGYSTTSTATMAISAARSSSTASNGVDGSAASPIIVRGQVTTTTNSGNLTLQWAENTGSATGTTLLAGSWLMARRIA
jgi:hypothetical protein